MDTVRLEPERHPAAPLARALSAARGDFAVLALAPERQRALGTFLRHLARGERVARAAAAYQVTLARDRRDVRFFRSQARQEALHAALFDTFAAWLLAPPLVLAGDPYAAFERRVSRAGFVESVVATQGVLEALGETMLARLEAGLARHGAGFVRLRRVLLRQEAAHHAFGTTLFERWRRDGTLDDDARVTLAAPYLTLANAMIDAGAPALEHFGIAPETLRHELRQRSAA